MFFFKNVEYCSFHWVEEVFGVEEVEVICLDMVWMSVSRRRVKSLLGPSGWVYKLWVGAVFQVLSLDEITKGMTADLD